MAIDRIATLRNAEKLLRQGRLEQAIAEYGRVVEDDPRDWNTANLIGDLYVRAGRLDKAVEQFVQIADGLSEDGFLQKAGALYKKIVKLKPDHEHALLHAADIVGRQGLYADARAYLNSVAELRRSRGEVRGVAQVRIRIGSLDPADFAGRIDAARARIDLGDGAGASRDLKTIASELAEQGRGGEAVAALQEAAGLDPDDGETRERLAEAYIEAGDYDRAVEYAASAGQLKNLAARFEQAGRADDALAALRRAAEADPEDVPVRARLAQALAERGDAEGAASYLSADIAGENPQLLFALLDVELRGGRSDAALETAGRILRIQDIEAVPRLLALATSALPYAPDAAFGVANAVASQSVDAGDWAAAAGVLDTFTSAASGHVPALMRLVEICVDGGLDAMLSSAQARLAEAYLASGAASEARFIADDLVAREPWDRTHIDRLRRILESEGEEAPDAIIAERLSAESPFLAADLIPPVTDAAPAPMTDVTQTEPAQTEFVAVEAPDTGVEEPQAARPPARSFERPAHARPEVRGDADSIQFALSSNAIDLASILGEPDEPPAVPVRSDTTEVDLSVVLDDMRRSASAARKKLSAPSDAPAPNAPPPDLDAVFAAMREEAGRTASLDPAEQAYRRGIELQREGRIDESVLALESAAKSPRLRFAAGSALARIWASRDMLAQAIEWFERAAEAPAPGPDEEHQLLYDLASALEGCGELERALAIFLELQANAGCYRDVPARIGRLARAQARG